MAILSAVFAAVFLTCLGMSLVLLGTVGTALSAHAWQGTAAATEAQAALTLAVSEIRARADWTGITSGGGLTDVCSQPGRFVDTTFFPRAPWDASPIDLHAQTTSRQAESDAATLPAGAAPVWRLFEYGPISSLVPSESRLHERYVIVWAADGGDGVILLHATALGAWGVRASVEAAVGTRAGAVARQRLTIRTVR